MFCRYNLQYLKYFWMKETSEIFKDNKTKFQSKESFIDRK